VIFLFHEMTVIFNEVMEQQIFLANMNGKVHEPLVKVNVLTAGKNELIFRHGVPGG